MTTTRRRKVPDHRIGPRLRQYLKTAELIDPAPWENPLFVWDGPELRKAWEILREELTQEWEAEELPGRPYGYRLFEDFQRRQERRQARKKEKAQEADADSTVH